MQSAVQVSYGTIARGATHEGIFVTVAQETVHVWVLHHVVGQVENSQVEAVVGALVKHNLA